MTIRTRKASSVHSSAGRFSVMLLLAPLAAVLALGTTSCCKALNDLRKDEEEAPAASAEPEPAAAEVVAEEAAPSAEEPAPEGSAEVAAADAPPAEDTADAGAPSTDTPPERSLVPRPTPTANPPVAQPSPPPTSRPPPAQPPPAATTPSAPSRVEVGSRTPRTGGHRTETPTGSDVARRGVRRQR